MTGPRQSAATAPSVVVIGPLPPPVNGMSVATSWVAERLREKFTVHVADTSPGSHSRGVFYHATKAIKVMRAMVTLLRYARAVERRLYLPADAGWGMLYTIALVAFARATGYGIFIHHHSGAYIGTRYRRMQMLTMFAGHQARHIMICADMQREFSMLYPAAKKHLTLSYAVIVKSVSPTPFSLRDSLRLGFLGNLGFEKGEDTSVAVLRALHGKGIPARLVLAGPVFGTGARMLIDEAGVEFGSSFEYRGAVYDEKKDEFFRDIDVFLFPSRYTNEIQGIVNLEAVSYGKPVVAYGRGCIPVILANGGGVSIDPEEDFVQASLPVLEHWTKNPEVLEKDSHAAAERFQFLRSQAAGEFEVLIDALMLPREDRHL